MEDLSHEDVAAAIDREVEALLEWAGIAEPPIDALELAQERLGLAVRAEPRRRPGRGGFGRAAPNADSPRAEASAEQRQWRAAQAIGTARKPNVLARLGLPAGRVLTGESLANLFARRLLVPTRWWQDEAPAAGFDLLQLKLRYATAPYEVIAWRMLDLPAECVISVLEADAVVRRRGNFGRPVRALHRAEQRCRRRVLETGQPQVVRDRHWTIHGWPLPGGPRLILRSVPDLDALSDDGR
jgi:hypothetical protein